MCAAPTSFYMALNRCAQDQNGIRSMHPSGIVLRAVRKTSRTACRALLASQSQKIRQKLTVIADIAPVMLPNVLQAIDTISWRLHQMCRRAAHQRFIVCMQRCTWPTAAHGCQVLMAWFRLTVTHIHHNKMQHGPNIVSLGRTGHFQRTCMIQMHWHGNWEAGQRGYDGAGRT